MKRPGAMRGPDTFGELKCVQHGRSTENEMTDSESGGPVLKESKDATSAEILEGQRDLARTVLRMEQRPSSAQNWASGFCVS